MSEVERNSYGDHEGQVQEPIHQNQTARRHLLDFFGQPISNQVYDQRQGKIFARNIYPGSGLNGHDQTNEPCPGPHVSGPPPGFHTQMPIRQNFLSGSPPPGFFPQMPIEYLQLSPPRPIDTRFNIRTPLVGFAQQMAPSKPPPGFFGPPGFACPPVEMVSFDQSVATPVGIPQMWIRFETQRPDLTKSTKRISRPESCSASDNDPWWRNRPTKPTIQLHVDREATIDSLINFGGGYGALQIMSSEERFRNQLKVFAQLPMDVHRKIRTMSGCEITDYFEVTIVRYRLQNIVDSSRCHAVFTKKPETGQTWLMAFSVTDRHNRGVKFNRLLTGQLKVKVNGKAAVEIKPSKVAQSVEGELYMFNFMSTSEAQKFMDVLERARSQVWNPDRVDHHSFGQKSFTKESQGYRFGRGDLKMPAHGSSSSALNTKCSDLSKYNRTNVLDTPTFRGPIQEKLWPQNHGGKLQDNDPGTLGQHQNNKQLKFVKFSSSSRLFINTGNENRYASLGSGKLSIVYHENSYDELVFVGPKKDVICHHHIYQWNNIDLTKGGNRFSCYWTAAIHLNNSPHKHVLMRELKMEVDSEETLLDFCKTFTEGVKKGSEVANTGN